VNAKVEFLKGMRGAIPVNTGKSRKPNSFIEDLQKVSVAQIEVLLRNASYKVRDATDNECSV
jgi:hypothetical protein